MELLIQQGGCKGFVIVVGFLEDFIISVKKGKKKCLGLPKQTVNTETPFPNVVRSHLKKCLTFSRKD